MKTAEPCLAWVDRALDADQGDEQAVLTQLLNERRTDLARMDSLEQVRFLVQAHAAASNLPQLFDAFEAGPAGWEAPAGAGPGSAGHGDIDGKTHLWPPYP
jgi:hypothetical protein